MKYLSLFSGIGGFELGIQQAYENNNCGESLPKVEDVRYGGSSPPKGNSRGDKLQPPTCIGYSEIDKYAIKIYEKHFPEHKNYHDITKINEKELPDFDLLVGGFPCQSFSIAGKRGGFSDTRGTLFFDIARILTAKRPRNLLLENVKGLLSHDGGKTFATILRVLSEIGYDLQWQVLNSKNFGVPQNRERVFIVGHLRGTPRPQVFPIGGTDKEDNDAGRFYEGDKGRVSQGENGQKEIEYTGDAHNEVRGNSPLYERGTPTINQLNNPNHSNDRVYGADGISPTLNTMQGGLRQPKVAKTVRTGGRSSPHGAKQNWDSYEVEGKIRRLTPVECARLQGFPDDWHKGIVSDSQAYKCYGNAVTTNVVKEIIKKLL